MTAKNFLCTLNLDSKEDWQEKLEHIFKQTGARYTVGQLEQGHKEAHFHIQFFMNFSKTARVSKITKVDKRIHVERVTVNNGADQYCMKEDTRVEGPIELGIKPFNPSKKTDWDKIKEQAKQGNLENIPSWVYVSHYNKLKAIAKDHMQFKDKDHLRGIWIWGKAGTGKSRWVRAQCKESLYPKLCNKWWDGYQGEKYVVMDDIMPQHNILAQQLKIWADRYDCILETKGGAVHSNYEYFIITSQYSIDQIFEDEKDREAIHRRFLEYKIKEILSLNLCLCDVAHYNTQVSDDTSINLPPLDNYFNYLYLLI